MTQDNTYRGAAAAAADLLCKALRNGTAKQVAVNGVWWIYIHSPKEMSRPVTLIGHWEREAHSEAWHMIIRPKHLTEAQVIAAIREPKLVETVHLPS